MKLLLEQISILDWCLLVALGILFAYALYLYIRHLAAVPRSVKPLAETDSDQPHIDTGDQLDLFGKPVDGVSVIVAARNEGERLKQYLCNLMEQDYPLFEVIVVNDGSEDHTQEVLEDYARRYRNLRITFVPHEARIRSSKKLALTLAIKAARYEYLLFTNADSRPESRRWISAMMSGFGKNKDAEVVLGYGAYFDQPQGVNDIIRYENLYRNLLHLGLAVNGYPYRGDGRNLLYRKSTFMDNRGFAGMLDLREGEDDLFINKVSTRENTEVVLAPEAVTYTIPKITYKEWIQQKHRHMTAWRGYRSSTRWLVGGELVMRLLWYIVLVLCFVLGNAFTAMMALLAFVLRFVLQIVVLDCAAIRLKQTPFGLDVIWYDFALTLLECWLWITLSRKRNVHW
ncbi:MAG: glycosyltransferase [Paludibacteraceae bacterium]|nr:glycosyltransferase [Paludibacteraceae bacterium]